MKSFAAVKTFARYHLGFTRRKPELKRVLLIYGFAAVIYRVLLISGIALVLYHLSFRLLGVALFAVEIWLFLAAPLFAEIKAMSALRRAAPDHRRLRRLGLIALVFLLAMFLPFSAQIGAPAIATHQHVVSIYTREGGISMVGLSKDAQPVPAHHVLLHLTHPDLVARLAQSETSTKILEVRRANMSVSDPDRTRIQAVEAEIDLEQERAQALRNQLDQLQLQSPEAGQFWPRDEVHPGQWIAARALVGQLVTGPQRAIAFVSERDLAAIERGGDAVFTDDFGRSSVRGRVTHIDLAASPSISFPELASVYGGPIEARSNGRNSLVSISSIYRVEIELEETPFTARTLGTARIYGKSRSLAERAGTWLIALFRREGHLN